MKRQIRLGVFETNSSSTHSMTICSQEEFNAWVEGRLLYNECSRTFSDLIQLNEEHKELAKEEYERQKDAFQKDWDDLNDEAKQIWYTKFAKLNNICDSDMVTYDEYMENLELEYFKEQHTTPGGEKIVVFGEFGYC